MRCTQYCQSVLTVFKEQMTLGTLLKVPFGKAALLALPCLRFGTPVCVMCEHVAHV